MKMKIELMSITPNAEELIEDAGRTCYQSESQKDYIVGTLINKLIKSGHDSVLEHGYATFRISEVSRALTHQLVRHRIASYSQQSQRYVREGQFDYVTPPSIYDLPQINTGISKDICNYLNEYKEDMRTIQAMYNKWKGYGMKNEDARFVLPNACHTEIVMSANFREFRNVFKVRCDKHAQWEIRAAAKEMLKQLYAKCPNVFRDLNEQFIVNEK
jgi:thymidylate synthase (FAD)